MSVLRYICIVILLLFISCKSDNKLYHENGVVDIREIINDSEGREYLIKTTLPSSFDKESTYEIVYYLDAWWLSDIIKGIKTILEDDHRINPIILVGISVDGHSQKFVESRFLNYTERMAPNETYPFSGDSFNIVADSNNTGGAKKFISFLSDKLIPTIEGRYNTNSENRGLIGHSLSGYLGHLSVINRQKNEFNKLILISPSLWWNNRSILNEYNLKSYINNITGKEVIYWVGKEEDKEIMIEPLKKLEEYVDSRTLINGSVIFKYAENENHNSILPKAIYESLEVLYNSGM